MHINFHPDHVGTIAVQYPFLNPCFRMPSGLCRTPSAEIEVEMSDEMKDEINRILHCNLGIGERELFFQARIRDLLRLYGTAVARLQAIENLSDHMKS